MNQIPLISEAKKLGFHVIGVDANVSAAGFYQCDLKIQESVENYDIIYKKLIELLVDGDIHGVMTKSYGPAIVTTSFLTEKFKIPFIPFLFSDSFIDKKKMKSRFIEHSIPTPYIIHQNSRSKNSDGFPVIVKPNVGHAKTNVRLASDSAELKKICAAHYQGDEEYILEKFIEGDEIIVAGIIHDGRYHLVEITDKKTAYPPYFIDMIHVSPSKYLHLSKKFEAIGQQVAEAFRISRSPLIMEMVINNEEDPYLIEAVPEFGGEFIPDVLIPASVNYNFIGEAIKSMTNSGFKPPQQQRKRNAVVVRYITGQKGVLASCNPEGPRNVDGTIFSRIFKEIGSPISDPVTNLDRIGVVVVSAATREEALDLSETAASNFNIRIK